MNPHLHSALIQSNHAEIARRAQRNVHAASIRPQRKAASEGSGRLRATAVWLRLVPRHV